MSAGATPATVVWALVTASDRGPDDGLALLRLARETAGAGRLEVVCLGFEPDDQFLRYVRAAQAFRLRVFKGLSGACCLDAEQLAVLAGQAMTTAVLAGGEQALVCLPGHPEGEALAARLAVAFDGCALGRVARLECLPDGAIEAERPAYGGRARLRLRALRPLCIAAVHTASVQAWPTASGGALSAVASVRFERHDSETPVPDPQPCRLNERPESQRPLEGAALVVSGGRGMKNEAGFAQLQALADRLGAALGASLPAVDAGWAPVARQVGYSGKYVTPNRYLAVGISGTAQHLAGIGPNTEIVAINHDPEADIFKWASVGVVADWQALLPELIAQLDAHADQGGRDAAHA